MLGYYTVYFVGHSSTINRSFEPGIEPQISSVTNGIKGWRALSDICSDSINAAARDWARVLSSPFSIGLLSSRITSANGAR
jgi:hypothetical protein